LNIQLNIVTFPPTYPEKFMQNNVVTPFLPTLVAIVTCPNNVKGRRTRGHPVVSSPPIRQPYQSLALICLLMP